MQLLPKLSLSGSPFEIGEELGRSSRPVLRQCLSDPEYARQASAWKEAHAVQDMMAMAARFCPAAWEELRGISAGSGIDLEDLYVWNCRPDFAKMPHDNSATLAVNRLAKRFIVHESLQSPTLRPYCRLVDVRPQDSPGFLALYVPGMLPGASFSVSRTGLVQSTDFLEVPVDAAGIPSAIIARSLLECRSLIAAIEKLMSVPRLGGAHHVLAWAGEFVMLSVEATAHKMTVTPVANKYAHTNHLIHAEQIAPHHAGQNTWSLRRYGALLDDLAALPGHPDETDILSWMRHGMRAFASDDSGMDLAEEDVTMLALLECHASKAFLQIFNADRSASQSISYSFDHSVAAAS